MGHSLAVAAHKKHRESVRRRKRVGDVRRSGGTALRRFPPVGVDHHVLPSVQLISDGSGITGKGQYILPEERASSLIEGAELTIEVSRRYKNQAAGSYNRSAIVFTAGILLPLRGQIGR